MRKAILVGAAMTVLSLGACTTRSEYTNSGGSGLVSREIGVGTATPNTGINMTCPASGTNSAGMPWHPGEYCIPGDGGNH